MPRRSSGDRFVVVSYNILGVDNATQHWRELYAHIPAFIMDWDRRKRNILLEIGLWSPDILCLQEVDRFDDLQNDFVQRGYEGIFKGRTGEANDGCAMFWRPERFRLLEEESIEFKELDLRNNVAQLCVFQAMPRKSEWSKSRRTVEGSAGNCVVVCNIHVLFNPNRGDIKLGQVRYLLMKAYSLSQKMGGVPVIVAGDFNSIPQSPLYQFLLTSTLDVSCFDRRKISGQVETSRQKHWAKADRWTSTTQFYGRQIDEEIWLNTSHSLNYMRETMSCENSLHGGSVELIEESTAQLNARPEYSYEHASGKICGEIPKGNMSWGSCQWTPEELNAATGDPSERVVKHSFKLQSAYSSIQSPVGNRDTVGEPLATIYHGKFMGTVDYIWFSEGLAPMRVLDILPIHVLQRTRGLPSKKWGSDHLALACEFAFLTGKKDN